MGAWSFSSLAWTWIGTSLLTRQNLDAIGKHLFGGGATDTPLVSSRSFSEAGFARQDVHLQRGLAWLRHNQSQADGGWPAYSLNKRHSYSSGTARFMGDAATAFAVLALTKASCR